MIEALVDNLLQDAEMASLTNSPDAFKLYDVAVKCVELHLPGFLNRLIP